MSDAADSVKRFKDRRPVRRPVRVEDRGPEHSDVEEPLDGINGTGRRPWTRPLLAAGLVVALAIAIMFGVRYARFAAVHVSTDDAAVSSDVTQISPQVSGTVKQVLVKNNQAVKAGGLLAVLDDATYRAAYDQAKANLDMAVAASQGAGQTVSLTSETGSAQTLQAQGVLAQAESSIFSAQADVARADATIATARAGARGADANVVSAQAALTAAFAAKQKSIDSIKAAEAQVDTANAGVRAAQSAVDAARSVEAKAVRDQKRYSSLVSEGAVSEQTADQANSSAIIAGANVEAARQQVASAQAVVAQKQADLNAARQQANWSGAAINQAKAQVAAAKEQAKAAEAGIIQTEAQKRASLQGVNQAIARKAQAEGQLNQARTAPMQVDVSRSAASQAVAKIEQEKAALDAARINLQYTRIFAPVSGRVSNKQVEVGAMVQPGTPLMSIVPDGSIWVTANFKETQLPSVRPGNRAEVEVDGLPGRQFHGKVESIAAGTGSTFTLLPPDNATGNFTKIVQRIPVRINLDPGQPDIDRLRPGMSVTATVETKR